MPLPTNYKNGQPKDRLVTMVNLIDINQHKNYLLLFSETFVQKTQYVT